MRTGSILATLLTLAISGCVSQSTGPGGEGGPIAEQAIESALGDAASGLEGQEAELAVGDGVYRARVEGHAVPPVLESVIWANGSVAAGQPPQIQSGFVATDGCCLSLGGWNAPVLKDVSTAILPDVPTQVTLRLKWENKDGDRASLFPLVRFPDRCLSTRFNPSYNPPAPVTNTGPQTVTFSFYYFLDPKSKPQNFCGTTKFEVGIEVGNNLVTTGIPYSWEIDVVYRPYALRVFEPYAVTIPENVTAFTLQYVGTEKEPQGLVKVFDPSDKLVHFHHGEAGWGRLPSGGIRVDTPVPGDYVVMVQGMSGGFLRIESSSPNVTARRLDIGFEREIVPVDGPTSKRLETKRALIEIYFFNPQGRTSSPVSAIGQGTFGLTSPKGLYRELEATANANACADVLFLCGTLLTFSRFNRYYPKSFSNAGPYTLSAEGTGLATDLEVHKLYYVR